MELARGEALVMEAGVDLELASQEGQNKPHDLITVMFLIKSIGNLAFSVGYIA